MGQRMLYKIFTYNREGDGVQLFKNYGEGYAVQNIPTHYRDAVHYIHTQKSTGCCTKYSKIAGPVQYLQKALGARKLYLKRTRGRLYKIFFEKNMENLVHGNLNANI
jgi:hypothetical protein